MLMVRNMAAVMGREREKRDLGKSNSPRFARSIKSKKCLLLGITEYAQDDLGLWFVNISLTVPMKGVKCLQRSSVSVVSPHNYRGFDAANELVAL